MPSFDTTKPLVMALAMQVNGHDLLRGQPVLVVDSESDEAGELTAEQAERLLQRGTLIYADRAFATPVESPEAAADRMTVVEELDDGQFLIRAPWLGEGEIVSADKVEDRAREVVQEGIDRHRELIDDIGSEAAAAVIAGQDGFAVTDLGGGNYEITGPGLDEPEKVRGKANADTRLRELQAAAATAAAATNASSASAAATSEVPTGAGTDQPIVDVAPPVGDATTGAAPTE